MSDEVERLRADLAIEADISNELRAELAAERANVENWKKANRLLTVQYHAEREKVAKLREALEPFAEAATFYDQHTNLRGEVMVEFADLHTARAVLEETGGGDG